MSRAPPAIASRRSDGRLNTPRITRATNGIGRCSASVARVASSRWPYGTPDGHTVSHARQPRHCAMCVSTLGVARRQRALEQRSHEHDAPARTVVLVLEREIRRAGLQTEAAVDAGVDARRFAGERTARQRALGRDDGRSAHAEPPKIPGFSTPPGSNVRLDVASTAGRPPAMGERPPQLRRQPLADRRRVGRHARMPRRRAPSESHSTGTMHRTTRAPGSRAASRRGSARSRRRLAPGARQLDGRRTRAATTDARLRGSAPRSASQTSESTSVRRRARRTRARCARTASRVAADAQQERRRAVAADEPRGQRVRSRSRTRTA